MLNADEIHATPNCVEMLDMLNGQRIRSLRALHHAYMSYTGEFFEFTFSTADGIVLAAEQCRESEAAILKMHAIPAIASEGILSESNAS